MKPCLLLLSGIVAAGLLAPSVSVAADRPVIGVQQKERFRVAFQVTGNKTDPAGVSEDLQKIAKAREDLLAEGIAASEIDIHVIIHGEAAAFTLTDEAWKKYRLPGAGNATRTLVEELTKNGVHLELCNGRRIKNGWEKEEIDQNVALVGNAFLRLADLELRGYALIKM